MASLETILKFAVPAAATICLIFQAFQHFRKKKKTSEQKNADKNSNDFDADSSISDVANKSDVEEEEEAGAVAKEDGENVFKTETTDRVDTHTAKLDGENVVKTETTDRVDTHTAKLDGENVVKTETTDRVDTHTAKLDGENVVKTETTDRVDTHTAKLDGENVVKTETEVRVDTHNAKLDCENVVKTEMEDGVNTNDANNSEMVQNTPGDKHRTNTSSGDGGSLLCSGDESKTGTDYAKQNEMVQKSADGKHRAKPDNFSMGDLHSDKNEVPIKPGESSDDSQLVKSTCTSLSDSLYPATDLDLESVQQDDIEKENESTNNSATVSPTQPDSDSGCASMESVPHVTMVPTGNGAGHLIGKDTNDDGETKDPDADQTKVKQYVVDLTNPSLDAEKDLKVASDQGQLSCEGDATSASKILDSQLSVMSMDAGSVEDEKEKGTGTSIRAAPDQQGTSRHTGFGRGAIPKSTTGEGTASKGLETQYSVMSTDGGELDNNERLDSLWQSQGLNEPEHSTDKQLPLISEASHPSSSQPILDLSQSLHVNQRHFHQSSSSPTIYKGGDSSLTIFGGCNTIGHVSFNLPSASAPDLGQGTFVSRPDSGFEGDFVIIYSDKDTTDAETFKKDLIEDIPDIKAELFPYIDQNKSLYESLETVLNRFVYVLVIMSPNFKSDAKSRRAGEDLLSDSFEEEHKRNRIVPVWMNPKKKDCPMEFKSLQGIRYYERSDEVLGRLYREGLRKQVDKMRKEADKKRREFKSQASLP